MHSLVWLLNTGVAQCVISIFNGCTLSDCIVQFSGPAVTVPQNYTMQSWRIVYGYKCTFHERKVEPSLSGLHNAVLVRQSLGQGCLDPPLGNWKQMWMWMHGDTECKQEWMIMYANGEWHIHKRNNMHVGETSRQISDRSWKIVSCIRQQWDSNENWNSVRKI